MSIEENTDVKPGNEVVNWDEELAKYAQAAAAVEKPTAQNISLRSGILSLNGQPAPGNKIEAIVLASVIEHRWFPDKFDPLNPTAPDCFAFSVDGVNMRPHENSADQQSATCADCKNLQWGSDPNSPSKRGKWCKQVRKLALVPFNSLGSADSFANSELAVLTVPVTSVGMWGNYVSKIASILRRPPCGVVTEIAVKPDPKTQFKVLFNETKIIEVDYLPMIMRRVPLAQQILMTPYEKAPDGKLSPKTEAMVKGRKYT